MAAHVGRASVFDFRSQQFRVGSQLSLLFSGKTHQLNDSGVLGFDPSYKIQEIVFGGKLNSASFAVDLGSKLLREDHLLQVLFNIDSLIETTLLLNFIESERDVDISELADCRLIHALKHCLNQAEVSIVLKLLEILFDDSLNLFARTFFVFPGLKDSIVDLQTITIKLQGSHHGVLLRLAIIEPQQFAHFLGCLVWKLELFAFDDPHQNELLECVHVDLMRARSGHQEQLCHLVACLPKLLKAHKDHPAVVKVSKDVNSRRVLQHIDVAAFDYLECLLVIQGFQR